MNSLAKSIFISVFFIGQLYGSPAPQSYVSVLNNGQVSSGATSFSGGTAGATVVALDRELGHKMNQAIGKHTQSVLQKSQENLRRTLANSEMFSRRLQADIQASVQKSLADTHASLSRSLANVGILPPGLAKPAPAEPRGGGFENLFGIGDNFAKNLQADISRTIAESQAQSRRLQDDLHKITNEAIQKAAKSGKLKVITSAGGGPVSFVSSSQNGQGIIVTGGQNGGVVRVVSDSTGGDPNVRIFSNVPINVSGGNPHDGRGGGFGKGQSASRRAAVPRYIYPPVANYRDNVIEPED